ncbi:AbrB family transcriptional regulator [Lyngbya confervoides]|uniref:AbrB family transcriptional regulator n=1 Tax=Lyngbya confervoides BDU141951 TaxID=1574623 RepID=A0ABD4T701_9CYAN|nr:AbrB family transcriptional regulator [Lyngbya confervoides]MCM1984352.1 AbrB family transcriptional regulator [Lyngbya confervoides BDU141951]
MSKKRTSASKPLEGQALLEYVKEIEHLPREEKARLCGYVSKTRHGSERINMMKFMNALLEAEGIELDGKVGNGVGRGAGGRHASYRISVQSNGNLLIGAAYTRKMDLQPGDEFEINLGRKHIHLRQVTSGGTVIEEED